MSASDVVYVALSPDASQLAVSATHSGGSGGATLWIQPTAGTGSSQTLAENTTFYVSGWTPDGTLLVGGTQESETGWDVAYLALADPGKVVHVTSSRFDEQSTALSPNGRFIAYASNETGRYEVFVCDFPACARKWQVSRSGANGPTWRSDSRELYFTGPGGASAVAVSERGAALDFGPPEALPFSSDTFDLGLGVQSTDGTRFLVARYDSEAYTEPIRLIRGLRQLLEK